MNEIQQIFIYFLIGCIGARSLLVYIAANVSKTILMYMGYISIIIGFGFLTIYFGKLRNTGKGAFGEKIWWNNLRPVHGILYLLFAYFAIQGIDKAWIWLLLDVLIGLIGFLWTHYSNGDFNKLF